MTSARNVTFSNLHWYPGLFLRAACLYFSFTRWSLWERLVKVEEGCMLLVSFFIKAKVVTLGLYLFIYEAQEADAFIFFNSSVRSTQSAGQSGTGHTGVCSSGEVSVWVFHCGYMRLFCHQKLIPLFTVTLLSGSAPGQHAFSACC